MTDRPITFSAPMVAALIERRKTQTRRIIKPQPVLRHDAWYWASSRYDNGLGCDYFHTVDTRGIMPAWLRAMPFAIGDRLWVRESLRRYDRTPPTAQYIATTDGVAGHGDIARHVQGQALWQWRRSVLPAIHMPRWASRITLTVTNVRIERLHEITLRDAQAEGCSVREFALFGADIEGRNRIGRIAFEALWETIHGHGAWAENPWVVALTFSVARRNIDAKEAA